ncbi:MAG: HIT domain-containing protein [Oligoflexia bacterium]|nr:HIT domain-containing protein [Oligoflexia bacterium]
MVKKKLKNKKASPKKTKAVSKRDTLFAPWRLNYIKGARDGVKQDCVFCWAAQTGPSMETLLVHQGSQCSIILNKFPYNNGHLMVIPHRHTADFDGLTRDEFEEIHQLLKLAYQAIKRAYNPQGLNVGLNLGRVAGSGIDDHLHYHLVPRWGGDTNFMPVIAHTKIISESLDDTFEKIKKAIDEIRRN